jgi:hypothetical protein
MRQQNGKWFADWREPNGQRRRKAFDTRPEAEAYQRAMKDAAGTRPVGRPQVDRSAFNDRAEEAAFRLLRAVIYAAILEAQGQGIDHAANIIARDVTDYLKRLQRQGTSQPTKEDPPAAAEKGEL